jgi:hypothetical protein
MAIALCNPFRVDKSVSSSPWVALPGCAVPLTLGYVVWAPLGWHAPSARALGIPVIVNALKAPDAYVRGTVLDAYIMTVPIADGSRIQALFIQVYVTKFDHTTEHVELEYKASSGD